MPKAIKVILYCEKCKKETEHWDNRLTRKGKQPHYKCADKECGNGIWDDDGKAKPKATSGKSTYSKSQPKNNVAGEEIVSISMYAKWSVEAAIATVKDGLDRDKVLENLKFYLKGIGKALNGDAPVATSTPAPEAAEAAEADEVVGKVETSVPVEEDEFAGLEEL